MWRTFAYLLILDNSSMYTCIYLYTYTYTCTYTYTHILINFGEQYTYRLWKEQPNIMYVGKGSLQIPGGEQWHVYHFC